MRKVTCSLLMVFALCWAAAAVEALAAPSYDYLISIDPASHRKFGLYYPATYKFRLAPRSRGLSAQVRYGQGSWQTLPEKRRGDIFNGINAVRFDYAGRFAYVSASFNQAYDSFYLRFVNSAGQGVAADFDSIPKYYDDRTAAVSIVLDDWNTRLDREFDKAVGYLQGDNLYFSVAVITGDVNFQSLQQHIDRVGDLMEIASHSRHHPETPEGYAVSGYDAEIAGSRDDLIANLTFNHKPFVPLYVEPFGYSDPDLETAVTAANYLVERCSNDFFGTATRFIEWSDLQGRYGRGAVTYNDAAAGDTPLLLSQANSKFDQALAVGGIYTLEDHPQNGYWHDGSYLLQHLDYIKGKSDLWYVPFGQMYQYHFLQEMRGNLRVQSLGSVSAQAGFTATPVTGTAPLSVSFTDSSTGSIAAWSWNFGDGTTATSRNPVHLYPTPGSYTARLTVTSSDGSGSSTAAKTIRATGTGPDKIPPIVTSFTVPRFSRSLTVPITSLAATDNVGVTGYLITESPMKPSLAAPGWYLTAAAPAAAGSGTTASGLPWQTVSAAWIGRDIGAVGAVGSDTFRNGIFTIAGGGSAASAGEDAFHYLYQGMSGDLQIRARVVSLEGDCAEGEAGVMIRQNTAAGAVTAAMTLGTGAGAFSRRGTENGATKVTSRAGAAPPYWVGMARSGNTISGYISSDGANWELLESDQVTMTDPVVIGLAAGSGATSAVCTATFDNVQ